MIFEFHGFRLYKSFLTKEEKTQCQPYIDALSRSVPSGRASYCTKDESGIVHHWVCLTSDFNGPVEEIIFPEKPFFLSVNVIKIRCYECKKEYILFDSRYHGYSGKFCRKLTRETEQYIPHFKIIKRRDGLPIKVCVLVEHDIDFEKFKSNTGIICSHKDYTDAYTWIKIYSVDADNKKRKIFEAETD